MCDVCGVCDICTQHIQHTHNTQVQYSMVLIHPGLVILFYSVVQSVVLWDIPAIKVVSMWFAVVVVIFIVFGLSGSSRFVTALRMDVFIIVVALMLSVMHINHLDLTSYGKRPDVI